MKSKSQRRTEEIFSTLFLIIFVVLFLGSFGSIISPLAALDSMLLERTVQVVLLLVLLVGILGYVEDLGI